MLNVMKSRLNGKTFLQTLFFFSLVTQICFAQWNDETNVPEQINNVLPIKPHNPTHIPSLAPVSLHPSFYDRKADWQWIIDSTWGSGESLSGKLATFDIYQNFARAYNSTFLWNQVNWDSLASSLRSQINDSTSRGGFATIIKNLSLGLNDGHAYAYDNVLINTPLNPGVPILADGSSFITHFGAGLTPLSDSSLLVYKVVPNHPLGLVPGDIILGYEGVPWSQIVRELIAGGVPSTLWMGGSPSSVRRALLWAAGESWHLFDTIDVKKYSTGQIEHLPLDQMVNVVAPSNYINNEQISVPGVPMPDGYYPDHGQVTYGIIDGTNIGYIYVYHEGYYNISAEFDAAVLALMQTNGLIIDIRLNWGGRYGLNTGISRIINHSTSTMDAKKRCSPNDLFSLCSYNPSFWNGEISQDVGTYYDRPVAVLLGPNCVSYGDISSWQFSYIPNAKMFGRSPEAIYSGMWDVTQPSRPGYSLQCPNFTMVDHYAPDLPRWGQEYPFLEEVWLTPDGVANGEDDVVNRALEWMNNLVYPHDILTDKIHYLPSVDTVQVTTVIENPNSHQLFARAYLHTVEGTLIDSVELVKQTVKTDGEEWIANFSLPSGEEFYKIGVTVFDETVSDEYNVSNATRFTTAEPVVLDSISLTQLSTFFYSVKPFIKNQSTVTTITNASVGLFCDDPWVISINPTSLTLPNIPPGSIVSPSTEFIARVDTSIFPNYFNFKVDLMSDGWVYWTDSMRVPPIAIISINPTEIDFGEVAIDSSETKTFTITNYGDEDLIISNISSSEPVFTVNITSAVVPPDSSQDVEVTFTPTGLLSFNGKIEITHNAAGSPDSVFVTGEGVTGFEEELQPLIFSLDQNYPNPFNPSTTIKYSVPELSKVKLTLFNLLGEEVTTLVNEEKVAGYYTLEFKASSLPSGIYFYQLRAGDYVETKKMVLIR